MFIAHYKSVNTSEEFYSTEKKDLNFPTQVEYKGSNYLLTKTIQFFRTRVMLFAMVIYPY